MNTTFQQFHIISVTAFLSGCVVTTYYTPPNNSIAQAKVRFLAADNIHYAVTMYEDEVCTKGSYSSFMGGPGYDLSKLLHSIPQPVKTYGNSLGMRNVPPLSLLSFIERNVPASKVLAFVINRGYGHNITPGIGYSTLSMKTCNLTFSFMPQAGKQYEVSFIVNSDNCDLSVDELEHDSKGKAVRIPVSTFHNLGQQCSVYTN